MIYLIINICSHQWEECTFDLIQLQNRESSDRDFGQIRRQEGNRRQELRGRNKSKHPIM